MSQAVGLFCALLHDSEPVVLDFPSPPAVSCHRRPNPPCHHSITSCSAAHLTMALSTKYVLCCLTLTIRACERKNPATEVSVIIPVFVFLLNQKDNQEN